MRTILALLPWVLAIALLVICLLEPRSTPWILLGVAVLMCWFRHLFWPERGLIGPLQIPAQDAFLPNEQVQWWYWNGHLQTEEGKRFGFEIVLFGFHDFHRIPVMHDQLVQAAITDVDGDSYAFEEFVEFVLPDRTKNGFNLSSGKDNKVTASGGGGSDHLHSEVGNYVLDLDLKSNTVAPHCGGGARPYAVGGYTYYYSRPRMQASGTLGIGGKSYKVTGTAWFDRQFGEIYNAISQGWQWFAIELEDNRQIMIYDFNGKDALLGTGSITDALGRTTDLAAHQFNITVLDHWTSPATKCTYPSGWEVTVEGQKFNIQPLVKNQELRGRHKFWIGPVYWEGACSVSGDVGGKAYVELNGYCRECP